MIAMSWHLTAIIGMHELRHTMERVLEDAQCTTPAQSNHEQHSVRIEHSSLRLADSQSLKELDYELRRAVDNLTWLLVVKRSGSSARV